MPSRSLIKDILTLSPSASPSLAVLNITTTCNLACSFCWIHAPSQPEKPKPIHIPSTDIIRIIHELADMKVPAISISGDGEPTLHPGFPAIVAAAAKRHMAIQLTSNLTYGHTRILKACQMLNRLYVNLSATTRNDYLRVHGHDLFNQVTRNIRTLLKNPRCPLIEMNYVITRHNATHIPDAIKLAKRLGVPSLRLRLLDTTPATEHLFPDKKTCAAIRTMADTLKIPKGLKTNINEIKRDLAPDGDILFSLHRCFIGWLRVSIESNGDIGFCCQHGKLTIGNWNTMGIAKAWTSPEAIKYRRLCRDKFDLRKPFWKKCLFCCTYDNNAAIDAVLRKHHR